MKVDSLGHASIFVRGEAGNILTDPLFYGEHHHGLYDLFPQRVLDFDIFPEISAVIISHAHLDHFDRESIKQLPRATPMIIPRDGIISDFLKSEGFSEVREVSDFDQLQIGSIEVTVTPAAPGALEHGFVFSENGINVWHLVDTVPTQPGIAAVKSIVGEIDVAIAPWQPLLDGTISLGEPLVFPFDFYEKLLCNIIAISPSLLIPGACGFKAIGDFSWTNHTIFPVTRERFMFDVREVVPQSEIVALDPGESITLTQPRGFLKSVEGYCRAVELRQSKALEWKAYQAGHLLREIGDSFSSTSLLNSVSEILETQLVRLINQYSERFFWNFRWKQIIGVHIAFSDCDLDWELSFSEGLAAAKRGWSPFVTSHIYTTASTLQRLWNGTTTREFCVPAGTYRVMDYTYLTSCIGLKRPRDGFLVDPIACMAGTPFVR